MGLPRPLLRRVLMLMLVTWLVSSASAQTPEGQFMCRRQQQGSPEDGGGGFMNVATMSLHKDGSFAAQDLTSKVPEVHGHFTYDAKKKTLEWDSGIWKTLLGHYVPNPSATDIIFVTTRKDSQGKTDGTLQCLRVAE